VIAFVIVLAYKFIEGESIYLYLNIEGVEEPLPIVLPWDLGQAKKIQELYEAARKLGKRGARVSIKRYDPSLKQFFVVTDPPQEKAMPPKEEMEYEYYDRNN
jgi:hypothetical protein